MLLKGAGGTLALPLLDSLSSAAPTPTATRMRFLVVGNPFGMHPEHFFSNGLWEKLYDLSHATAAGVAKGSLDDHLAY